jgi:hypothetical protein
MPGPNDNSGRRQRHNGGGCGNGIHSTAIPVNASQC